MSTSMSKAQARRLNSFIEKKLITHRGLIPSLIFPCVYLEVSMLPTTKQPHKPDRKYTYIRRQRRLFPPANACLHIPAPPTCVYFRSDTRAAAVEGRLLLSPPHTLRRTHLS